MHQNDRRGAKFECPPHDLARVNRGMIDGANALNLIGDEMVLLVEKEHAEFLVIEKGHCGPAIVDDSGKARKRRAVLDRRFGKTLGRRFDDF